MGYLLVYPRRNLWAGLLRSLLYRIVPTKLAHRVTPLLLRAPIESLLKQVPPTKPVYPTLTPAHIAANMQGHASRIGIEKLLATKDKDTHQVHNLGMPNNTNENSSSALSPEDNQNDGLDFDVIRALESKSSYFLCDGKDHRIATYPHLTFIKRNDLAMRVYVAAIGPRRDSRPNERPLR
jgi:hypothetical protein